MNARATGLMNTLQQVDAGWSLLQGAHPWTRTTNVQFIGLML